MNQMSFTIVNNTICPDWYLNQGPLDLQSNTLPLCHSGCWHLVLITLVGLFNDSFAISQTAYLLFFVSLKLLDKRFSIESCNTVIGGLGAQEKSPGVIPPPLPRPRNRANSYFYCLSKLQSQKNKFSIPNLGVFCLESYFCQRKINITVGEFHKTF